MHKQRHDGPGGVTLDMSIVDVGNGDAKFVHKFRRGLLTEVPDASLD